MVTRKGLLSILLVFMLSNTSGKGVQVCQDMAYGGASLVHMTIAGDYGILHQLLRDRANELVWGLQLQRDRRRARRRHLFCGLTTRIS